MPARRARTSRIHIQVICDTTALATKDSKDTKFFATTTTTARTQRSTKDSKVSNARANAVMFVVKFQIRYPKSVPPVKRPTARRPIPDEVGIDLPWIEKSVSWSAQSGCTSKNATKPANGHLMDCDIEFNAKRLDHCGSRFPFRDYLHSRRFRRRSSARAPKASKPNVAGSGMGIA